MSEKSELDLQTGFYVIELLRAALEGRKPQEKPEALSMERIYRMAKKHSVECMAYAAVRQIAEPEDAEILKRWKERSRLCGIQGAVQKAEGERLFSALPAQGIRILPLKGCVMKGLYPKPEYRQMCDVDILIDQRNLEKAGEIMKELGYVRDHSCGGVDSYEKKPWMSVELHGSVLPDRNRNAKRYRDVWSRTHEKDGVHRMDWNDYYLYMIDHFAKHYFVSGSGIRSVLDIFVFLRRKGGELDEAYLREEFRKRGLETFRKEMEELAGDWFGRGVTGKKKDIEEIVIGSGVYGTESQRVRNLKEAIEKQCRISWLVKPIYLWKRMFLGYSVMCDLYPALRKCPVLLPVLWIHRPVKALIVKRETVKREFASIKGKKNE